MGFALKDVTWDMDRQVFLASTSLVSQDFPIAFIVEEVRARIERGWRLGSYNDSYRENEPEEAEADTAEAGATDDDTDLFDADDAALARWPTVPPRSRPAHFNRTFGVLTHLLAETYNNQAVAYAMHKTKLFFTEKQLKGERTAAMNRYRDAVYEFERMSIDQQVKWRGRIVGKYPSLAEAVKE